MRSLLRLGIPLEIKPWYAVLNTEAAGMKGNDLPGIAYVLNELKGSLGDAAAAETVDVTVTTAVQGATAAEQVTGALGAEFQGLESYQLVTAK